MGLVKKKMKKKILILLLVLGIIGNVSAVEDSFEDGDYTNNPSWTDNVDNEDVSVVSGTSAEGSYSVKRTNFDGTFGDNLEYVTNNPIKTGDNFTAYMRVSDTSADHVGYRLDNKSSSTSGKELLTFRNGDIEYRAEAGSWDQCDVYTSPSSGTWYKVVLQNQGDGTADVWVLDSNGNQLAHKNCVSDYDGYDQIRMWENTPGSSTVWYGDVVTYGINVNNPPSIDSKEIDPDPPKKGKDVTYRVNASDPNNNFDYTNLTVDYGSTTVVQDQQNTSTEAVFEDVTNIDKDGVWLNATIEAVDEDGLTTTEYINRSISEEPQIESLECEINNNWDSCDGSSSQTYDNTITRMRATILEIDTVEWANFTLANTYDDEFRFQDQNYTSVTVNDSINKTYIYDNTDQDLNDSGGWNATVRASDGTVTNETTQTWSVPWGSLSVTMNQPSSDIQVQQNQTFTMDGTATCSGGECASVGERVELWADPRPISDPVKASVKGEVKPGTYNWKIHSEKGLMEWQKRGQDQGEKPNNLMQQMKGLLHALS